MACALEATPPDIIIAEMQAMTARDSFVMTSHPSKINRRIRNQHLARYPSG